MLCLPLSHTPKRQVTSSDGREGKKLRSSQRNGLIGKKEIGRKFQIERISSELVKYVSLGHRFLSPCATGCCCHLLNSLVPPACRYLGYLIHKFHAQLGLPLIPTLPLLTKKFLSVFCGQVLKEKWVAFSFYLFSSINRVTLVDSVCDPELFFSFLWTTLSNHLCWSTGFMIQSKCYGVDVACS